MRKMKKLKLIVISIILLAGAVVNGAYAVERRVPEKHPIELTEMPECSACHPEGTTVTMKPIATFDHTGGWIQRHRFAAAQSDRLCNACHKASFCADCHANKDELKPSEKYSGSQERWLPHRGDYIFQHRIDGKIDPLSCYRCHGTQHNQVCKRCHK
jgi:hypothetical protein